MRTVAALCLSTAFAAAAAAQTPDYDMKVAIAPEQHELAVSGTVTLPAADAPRSAVEFTLSSLMKDVVVRVADPSSIAADVNGRATDNPDEKLTRWQIRLTPPLPAGTPLRLQFSYGGGSGIAFTYYIGPEGSFAGQNSFWYPQFNDVRARGRVTFSVPDGYLILSTGAQQAADDGTFVFTNSVPTRFAFAAGRYTIVRRTAIVPMSLYLLHPRANAAAYLDGASHVLATLSKEFGPYPYAAFAIAEVPTEQAQQASFSGASMNGFMLANREALDAPFNLAYYGHEIGHQWWANLVTHTGEGGAYMLDEAMAQYGSLRVVEEVDGFDAAERYRRSGYPGYNPQQSGYGYLLSTGAGRDRALASLADNNWSHFLADAKGFLVWDLLSRTIGRDRFRAALHEVTRDFAFRSIRWNEFLAIVQKHANSDLQWFDRQWFDRTGAPDWRVEWRQTGTRLSGTVTQSGLPYRGRVEVEIDAKNGERTMRSLEVDGAETKFSWPASSRVRSVVLDPHFFVVHWLPELRGAAGARAAALNGFQLTDAKKYDQARAELEAAMRDLPVPDGYGARYWTEYAFAYLAIAQHDWRDAQIHLDAALAAPTRDADTLPWLYWRYAVVAKNLSDPVKLRWAVDAAAGADAAAGGSSGAPFAARSLLDH